MSSLGLLVKYGDAQGPIPEVFGWAEDGGQGFIYMFLIHGGTVEERWRDFSEDERLAVCSELRSMTTAWRALTQDQQDCYVGNSDRKTLTEVFFWSEPKYQGPFYGVNAIQQLQEACRIETNPEAPITFTHNDLVPPNILLTPGPNPKVAAIIDWAQSGWYPSYWEYCKARYVNVLWGDTLEDTGDGEFLQSRAIGDKALQNEWWTKYLPLFLDPVDERGSSPPMAIFRTKPRLIVQHKRAFENS